MIRRAAVAPVAFALAVLLPGCVSLLQEPGPLGQTDSVPAAVVVPPPPRHDADEAAPRPAPPKPSLSRLTDRERPHIDFFGATIYADSISGEEADGHVFLDGRDLHRVNRSFPIAVYAGHIDLDLKREKVTLSDWPIVQTDSAYVQAQDRDTVIVLNRDRMAKIRGPARYVIGNREDDLFAP